MPSIYVLMAPCASYEDGKPVRGPLVEPMSEGEVRNWLEIKLARK